MDTQITYGWVRYEFMYYLIGMTDMSYNVKCTFAEIFIFIRVIVQKYNLVYIVRVLVERQYRH